MKQRKIFEGLFALLISCSIYLPAVAQIDVVGPTAATRLSRYGVDVSNVDSVRKALDDDRIHISSLAARVLADMRATSAIPNIRQKYLRVQNFGTSGFDLIYSLHSLGDPDIKPLLCSFVDSVHANYERDPWKYYVPGAVSAARWLLDFNDYSRVEFVVDVVQHTDLVTADASSVLGLFVKGVNQNKKEQIYSLLLEIVRSHADNSVRWATLDGLKQFLDRNQTVDALTRVSEEDVDALVRISAMSILASERGGVAGIFDLIVRRLNESPSAYEQVHALDLLRQYGCPEVLHILKDFIKVAKNDTARVSAEFAYWEYLPPKLSSSARVIELLDTLDGLVQRVVSFGWLTDQTFVDDLDSDLQRAHQALILNDSVSCSRTMNAFQNKIDIVYKDSLNPDPRKVTVEGWKYLYYNAQYILDRLPQIPPSPVIVSLNPATAYAGGSDFTLRVKGKAFVPACALLWSGSPRTTLLIADSALQATILASDIATSGMVSIAVVNPGNDTSNAMSFAITQHPLGLVVKLVNSTGTNLTGGSLQYYDASWKDAINNNDGTFNVNTTLATVSLRMTYEGGSQTKSNVTVGLDVVVFQTVNTQVKLQNGAASPIDTGTVQYYYSSWRTFDHTMNGVASKELLPGNYTFRMSYAAATNDKQQDISTNATVIFTTVNASVQLKNSQGGFIDQGSVQYYSSSWQNLGTTTNGMATKELLPGNYTFRMTYASATNDKQQNIGSNPTVVFQTVNTAVQLQNSQGALIDTGTVQYYFSSWQAFGHTVNGVATAELLPANYTFRMSYASATKDKQQNIGANPIVVFNTVNATVQLTNSLGAFIDQGTVQYYFSSWKTLGPTMNGVAMKELLPASYTFRMTHETVTNDKVQNISTNNTVSFGTVLCTITVKNAQGQPVNGAQVSYYFSSWRTIGATVGGQVTKELLPANMTFRETIGSATQNKVQNIGTNGLVEFVVQ